MKFVKSFASVCLVAAVVACGNNPEDPLEPMNRAVHEFNKGLDRYALRPVSKGIEAVTNEEARQSITNVSDNLKEPLNAANHVLQGDFGAAFKNASRFVLNTVYGVGGLADAAAHFGLPADTTNFGQTLAKWGVPEGPYVEIPVFGPNTLRSAAGLVVDRSFDPFTEVLSPEEMDYFLGLNLLQVANNRAQYGNLFDLALYQSPDSYLATRLAYLQNQRAQVEKVTGEADSDTVELENFYE